MTELTILEKQDEIAHIANMMIMYCENSDEEVDYNIQELLEMVDLENLMKEGYSLCIDGSADYDGLILSLQKFIRCLNYLENETDIPTTVSDETYDKVLELINDHVSNQTTIGTSVGTITSMPVKEHLYPELRGSLKKVYFCEKEEVPKYDHRKSLEEYFRSVFERIPDNVWDNRFFGDREGVIKIQLDFKYDGHSGVFECTGNTIDHVLTRYKVEQNLGKDITHIFKGKSVQEVFPNNLPFGYADTDGCRYGIQVEIIMKEGDFRAYKEYTNDTKCNRRSAVSSIINQTEENFDPNLYNFLTVVPLVISGIDDNVVGVFSNECCRNYYWYNIGYVGDKFLCVSCDMGNVSFCNTITKDNLHCISKEIFCNELSKDICNRFMVVKRNAEAKGIPIDGVVLTVFNNDMEYRIPDILGRTNDKNNFQVAFKFPAGIVKTTVQKVTFQMGPLGNITPVAEFEPVVINGNRLSRVNLSNMDKLERLQLHVGDEILIQYDIIPKIVIDETCKKVEHAPVILPISECPVCGEPLDPKTGYRCVNWDCASKTVGRIFNYVKKMRIPRFGINVIQSLHTLGMLNSIRDLYLLGAHVTYLVDNMGFGRELVIKLISAPLSRFTIYPHELLGSLGIPSISLHTMEKVCRAIPLENLVNAPEVIIREYQSIPHIGEKTARKIAQGIERCKDELLQLIPWFTFKSYKEKPQHVVFHTVRDKKFEQWLLEEKGICATSGITDALALIVSDEKPEKTDKIKRAKENQVPVITISEAKKKWGYNK